MTPLASIRLAASSAGVVFPAARLGAFDARSMDQHLAAFHSITGAIEDLEIDDLEKESTALRCLGICIGGRPI